MAGEEIKKFDLKKRGCKRRYIKMPLKKKINVEDEDSQTSQDMDKIGQTYKKMSQVEHVLNLPDTYIGSVEHSEMELWLVDKEEGKMKKKNVNIVPGFYKIFDEI